MEEIKLFKTADQYTEKELSKLPPVPNDSKLPDGRSVWMWTGTSWCHLRRE